jgi:hypothetical protein
MAGPASLDSLPISSGCSISSATCLKNAIRFFSRSHYSARGWRAGPNSSSFQDDIALRTTKTPLPQIGGARRVMLVALGVPLRAYATKETDGWSISPCGRFKRRRRVGRTWPSLNKQVTRSRNDRSERPCYILVVYIPAEMSGPFARKSGGRSRLVKGLESSQSRGKPRQA